MNIVTYSNQDIRDYISKVSNSLEDSKRVSLPYTKWMEKFLPIMYNRSRGTKEEIPQGTVRYVSTHTLYSQYKTIEQEILRINELRESDSSNASLYDTQIFELMKEAFKPEYEFPYDGKETLRGLPIWYLNTIASVNMIIGPRNLDLSDPTGIVFNDDVVHNTLQGTTGCGKSVAMRDIMFNLMLLFPPWEIDIIYIDQKGSEGPLFARKTQEAHCKVIAATNSKDFLLNMYESFREENELRQRIFSQAGCSGLKDFRKKFNLVLPREIYILDEFLQGILAIEESEVRGNKKAGDEMNEMFMKLTKIATLGRNAGIHMMISSQDLGSKLRPSIANQIQSGIVLACTGEVSTNTIGNNFASGEIDRKGIAIINSQRLMNDNSDKNCKVGVPFMDDTPRAGQQYTLPEELLFEIEDVRKKYDFYKGFYFYDATVKISTTRHKIASEDALIEVKENPTSMSLKIPLGETISYTDQHTVFLTTSYKANDAIAIDTRNEILLKYMLNVISKGYRNIKGNEAKIKVMYTEDGTLKLIEDTILVNEAQKVKVRLLSSEDFALVSNRVELMQVQELLDSKGLYFNINDAFRVYSESKYLNRKIYERYENELLSSLNLSIDKSIEEWLKEPIMVQSKPEDKQYILNILKAVYLLGLTRSRLNLHESEPLREHMLEPILVFWFNLEDVDNIFDGNTMEGMSNYLSNSGKVNVTNVVYSSMWAKFSRCIPAINHVLEFSNRDFSSEIGVPSFIANVNDDSLILHDKRKSKSQLMKIYGGI